MARRKRQWYETDDGKRRLQVEYEAIQRFNANRLRHLRLEGRKHKQGHLIVAFAFQPLASKPELIVRGEVVYSAWHPEIEPVARITSPTLQGGKHLLCAEMLRNMLHNTIPLNWAREGSALCMWIHDGGSNNWEPTFTIATVVNNIQSWYLNYLFFCTTGRWVFDETLNPTPPAQPAQPPRPAQPAQPVQRRLFNRLPNEVSF
jgi:hypothetical protein